MVKIKKLKKNKPTGTFSKNVTVPGLSRSAAAAAAKLLHRIQLCATPQMAAHQAPPSLGFSRQEHWSGLPFPSPVHESEK